MLTFAFELLRACCTWAVAVCLHVVTSAAHTVAMVLFGRAFADTATGGAVAAAKSRCTTSWRHLAKVSSLADPNAADRTTLVQLVRCTFCQARNTLKDHFGPLVATFDTWRRFTSGTSCACRVNGRDDRGWLVQGRRRSARKMDRPAPVVVSNTYQPLSSTG
ncbi:Secreted protein [Plasmodiophora brassicae]|uniref:Secreted protein n=1 Tax=Plasmodiophora brassicae TaxID=37360 RepID=A0A0G4J0V5_PLABS|nr:hypothetical protein PBRA_008424 [Plasmodiophora brassicae]